MSTLNAALMNPVVLKAFLSAVFAALYVAHQDEQAAIDEGKRPSSLYGMTQRVRLWLDEELKCPNIHGKGVGEIDIEEIPDSLLAVCLKIDDPFPKPRRQRR